tara:strand:+ start:1536 stop:1817 length:282 start_codon:yes stop_codon:yes gene_type:complete
MNEINEKLNIILNKLENVENRLSLLEKDTKDIHQFVPFVGWLDDISKKIINIPTLSWLKGNKINYIENVMLKPDSEEEDDTFCDKDNNYDIEL